MKEQSDFFQNFMNFINPFEINSATENEYISSTLYMSCLGLKFISLVIRKLSSLRSPGVGKTVFRKRSNATHIKETLVHNEDLRNKLPKSKEIIDLSLKSNTSDEMKKKKRPNYFVAVQITNPEINKSVKDVQEHILLQNKKLEKSMISRSTLHITLMVMHLKDSEDHFRAMKALKVVHHEYNHIMCREPLMLEFSGIGNFRNKVIFAKIKENQAYERFIEFAKRIQMQLAAVGVLSTDKRKEFTPHLTISKLDFSKKTWGINKILPSLYEEFINLHFGYDTVKSIQLLKMDGPKTASGYYSGDELYFSTDDHTSWKKLNSLLAIAEKKEEIREKISKITKKLQ